MQIEVYRMEAADDSLTITLEAVCDTFSSLLWDIEYYKGLSALEDSEYKELIQNPNIYYYELDDVALDELEIWFGKDADKRKEKLLN